MRAASARSWIWRASSAALFAAFSLFPEIVSGEEGLKLRLSTGLSRAARLAVTEVLMQVDVNQQVEELSNVVHHGRVAQGASFWPLALAPIQMKCRLCG